MRDVDAANMYGSDTTTSEQPCNVRESCIHHLAKDAKNSPANVLGNRSSSVDVGRLTIYSPRQAGCKVRAAQGPDA